MKIAHLQGRTAIVTGGSSGIGLAIAQWLSASGVSVAAWDIVEPEGIDNEALIRFERVDVSKPDQVKKAMKKIGAKQGGLDILVNCAGVGGIERTKRISDALWKKMLAVHLDGTFYCCREALAVMEAQGRGKIINMASICALTGCNCAAHYSAAKGAVVSFTKAVAKEAAPRGVYVNAVAPGYVETPLLNILSEEQRNDILKEIPLGRFGTPEEIASLVLYLASDFSNFIVGQVISPNGGQVI